MSSSTFLSCELLRATDFAAQRHSFQRRKNGDIPYINHSIGVALLVTKAYSAADQEVDLEAVVAALLHDVVEDTETSLEEIEQEFGSQVRSIVAEVTDDKSLAKVTRKRLQVEKAPSKSTEAKMVKLADKLYNLKDLQQKPPPNWTLTRVQGYFVWAYHTVAGMTGTNSFLEEQLEQVFQGQFRFRNAQGQEEFYPCLPSHDPELLAQALEYYYRELE